MVSGAAELLLRKRLQTEAESVDFMKGLVRHGGARGSALVQVAKGDPESENGPVTPPEGNRRRWGRGRIQAGVLACLFPADAVGATAAQGSWQNV